MSRANRRQSGFSIIEALAAVVLIAVGISATITALGAFSRSQSRAADSEKMLRLAYRKFDEIAALDLLPAGQSSGDFSELGEPNYKWSAERSSTGYGNLDLVRIDVSRKDDDQAKPTEIQSLLCRPAAAKPGGKS